MVNFFGRSFSEAALYSIWLHTGTLLSATVYFRGELLNLVENLPAYVKNPKKDTYENRITTFMLASTVLSAIIGLPVLLIGLDKADFSGKSATALIGFLLIFTGLLQKYSKRSTKKREITLKDGMVVGTAQAFSALPGISRSGITTSTLLLRRYDAKSALRLSFLMSIPAVLAAEVGLAILGKITIEASSFIAVAISFAIGLLTIGILMDLAGRINFGNFCIILGLLSTAPLLL